MSRVSFFLLLLVISNFAQAYEKDCEAQKVFWDSDGHSPYENHAECVGNLNAGAAGSEQEAQALTNEEAGGVGFATFKCDDGVWKIDSSRFGQYESPNGYCAD